MSAPQTYRRWVVGAAALTVGITVTHVLEDFVYGVPARFGLAVLPAAALLGAVYTVHVLVIVLTSSDRNSG